MNNFGNTLAALSFISFVLLVPAFAWHCRCKNIPASSLIFWLMFDNLVNFINACIWSGDNFSEVYGGQGYCDVVLKIGSGSSSGKVACISGLAMNLYFVLAAKNVALIDNRSKKKLAANIIICWFQPIFIMATNYIIQVVRYSITRYRGCINVYDESIATIMLYSVWPLVWSVVGLIFAFMTTFQYFKIRNDVKDILRCTNTGLDIKRFARLLIFSFLVICACFPLAVIYFVSDVRNTSMNFSFAAVHSEGWSTITYWDFGTLFTYTSWITIGLSVITFLLFGIGSDALELYKHFLYKIGVILGNNSGNILSFQLSKECSKLSKSTRFDSNTTSTSARSKVTFGSSRFGGATLEPINSNRMVDFQDYDELISQNEENLSPFTLTSKQSVVKFETESFDLEKGSTNIEELGYDDVADTGFGYNYQVKQKK